MAWSKQPKNTDIASNNFTFTLSFRCGEKLTKLCGTKEAAWNVLKRKQSYFKTIERLKYILFKLMKNIRKY